MNTAIATRRSGGFEEGQFAGIGLAIPIEMIEPVVSQLIDKGVVAKGYLGVAADDILPALATELRKRGFVGSGVFVTAVPPDGPALDSGVRVNDVITHVNDEPIRSMSALRAVISSMLPGEIATLRVWRYDEDEQIGEEIIVPVQLDRLDTLLAAGVLPQDQSRESIPELGIARMTTSTLGLAREQDVEYHEGVLIMDVVRGSELDGFGVRPGSVIVAVRDRAIRNVDELIAALREHDLLSQGVRVTVILPTLLLPVWRRHVRLRVQ